MGVWVLGVSVEMEGASLQQPAGTVGGSGGGGIPGGGNEKAVEGRERNPGTGP